MGVLVVGVQGCGLRCLTLRIAWSRSHGWQSQSQVLCLEAARASQRTKGPRMTRKSRRCSKEGTKGREVVGWGGGCSLRDGDWHGR